MTIVIPTKVEPLEEPNNFELIILEPLIVLY
jgi:hypothetical protein